MPNAVEHNGKVYILNPEPKGDYAERVGAPHLSQALNDFGIQTVTPNSYGATTNAAAAKALATGNPNLTGVNFRTEFDKIELLEVKLPAGMSAEDGVKALNNYDPKTQAYTDKKLADDLIRRKTEGLSAKSSSNAIDITQASGVSPHATVTEQLMANAEKIDKQKYIVTQQGTSFTVESRVDGHKMTVGATIDPKFPDRVQLQISANGYDADATKFKEAVGAKLLDGVLKDNNASTIRSAVDFVSEKKIAADITPEKARKVAEARAEAAKGTLIGQTASDQIAKGLAAEKVETIAPGVRENPSRTATTPAGGNTLEDLLNRSGTNDPLHQQQIATDEVLHAKTLAKVEALRAAGHISADVTAEEVVKKAGAGQTFNQLMETGQRIGEFKSEVRTAMDSLPESRGNFLDRMAEAERIATTVIAERDFKKGITILQQSNPHLAAMSEAEIKSLASSLQDSGKPVDINSFTDAAKQYRTYLDTHAPASSGNAFTDILNASDPAMKRAALDHAVSGGTTPNRMGASPVQGPSLLDEIINRSPHPKIEVPHTDVEVERTQRVATDADRAFVDELLRRGTANMPATPPSPSSPIHIRPESPRASGSGSFGNGGGSLSPIQTSGSGNSFTGPSSSPPQITPQHSPNGPVMSAVSSINSGTTHLIDQTASTVGHTEVLGATALKPKLQEDLRPDIRETPVVTQVARPNAPSANEPIHTPSRLAQAPTQGPLAGINTSAPAANSESFAPPKPATPRAPATPVASTTATPATTTSPTRAPEVRVETHRTETPRVESSGEQRSTPTAGRPSTPSSTLNKVGNAAGRAEMGIAAGAQLAQGNVVGATTTLAQGVATNMLVGKASEEAGKLLLKQGLKSAGIFVGVGATLAFGEADVRDRIKKGNYGAAAIEGVTLIGEAVGNVLPSGLLGSGIRETFRAAVVNTIGEKYAPEKSGLRKAAELGMDVASALTKNSQYASMNETALRKVIEADATLPKTVVQGGKTISLVDAMKDDTFRQKFVADLEKAEAKGHDLSAQVSMVKAYDTKLIETSKDPKVIAQRDAARDASAYYANVPII